MSDIHKKTATASLKNIRTTQDDGRENMQIEKFALTPGQGRSNGYIPDASLILNDKKFDIELKTFNNVKRQVSTCRNTNLKKINEYRNVPVWIISEYEKTQNGDVLTGCDYVLFPEDMEPWFQKQEHKINFGGKTYPGMVHWNQAKQILEQNSFDASILKKLDYMIQQKGSGLNDPKIGLNHLRDHGRLLDQSRPADHLRELVLEYYCS